jgi:hypothetical protein
VPKTPFDQLLDLMLEAPALMSRAETLVRMDCLNQKLQECLDLVNVCLRVNQDLEKLYSDLETSVDGPLSWPATEKTAKSESEIDNPVPIEFHFIDIRIGTTLIFY